MKHLKRTDVVVRQGEVIVRLDEEVIVEACAIIYFRTGPMSVIIADLCLVNQMKHDGMRHGLHRDLCL